MKHPELSVVMPIFNGGACVGRALESLREQDFQDFELVAVDDGSSDSTAGILAGFARRDPRIRTLRQEHAGIVRALNRGIECSRAPVIARMDADDVSLPGRLSAQLEYLRGHPDVGVIACRVGTEGSAGKGAKGFAEYVRWQNRLLDHASIFTNRFVESPVTHPSVMYRKELVERFGGYREGNFPEDYELWLRWMEAGVVFHKLPEVLLQWHDSPDRLTRVDRRYSRPAFFRVKARYLARWLTAHETRPVLIWGSSRIVRRRSRMLTGHGVPVAGFVTIEQKPGSIGDGIRVYHYRDIPSPEEAFVVSYVGERGARSRIRAMLRERGFVEGNDFLCAT